jgi:hypothetical protein
MVKGTAKMEEDAKAGQLYSTPIRLQDEEEEGNNKQDCEKGVWNKWARTERTSEEGCKCGGQDHKQISSTKCPWKGLSKTKVAAKNEERNPTAEPTMDSMDSSSDLEKIVQ